MSLLLGALLAIGLAHAQEACGPLAVPPESMQVAWISPVRRRAHARTWLSVVRVADLRTWIRTRQPDQERLLQLLGIWGRRGDGPFRHHRWKITVFDVRTSLLCRPVEYASEVEWVDGVVACPSTRQQGVRHDTGCGTTLDTATGERGLDLFRIRWRDAARSGFCVLPLDRFLSGA
ncbi:MAG: hypothetical protein JXB39_04110 [Deltaproteobacteria bacterium]|nr:hypothetical protein [Deltaproteobacteria bacterium]